MPSGYSARPASLDDVPVLADLVIAHDVASSGKPYMEDTIATWTHEDWTRPRFEPGRDSWVVTAGGGEIVGYADTYDEDPHSIVESRGRVHPDHWGRGIGAALVDLIERRASEHVRSSPNGTVSLLHDVSATDRAAHELLENRGYALDRHFWHMSIELGGALPDATPPEGVEIRAFDRDQDAVAVHALLEDAFRDHYQFSPTPYAEWEKAFSEAWFDPGLWLVAVADGQIAGALTGRVMGAEGWVIELGVLPGRRGRGIGAALLARSFEIFTGRGLPAVALNVDAGNETGATALYERVGMRSRFQWDVYLKVLRRGTTDSKPGPATPRA